MKKSLITLILIKDEISYKRIDKLFEEQNDICVAIFRYNKLWQKYLQVLYDIHLHYYFALVFVQLILFENVI